jgi:integrase/recombinase XerD
MAYTPSKDNIAIIESFLDALWMERGLSENTLASYGADLRGFAAWRREDGLLQTDSGDIESYLAYR